MILECSHCGAPLDVKEGATLVRCHYCRVTTERTRMRTLHTHKPVDFRPPPKWTPPAHVAANSELTLAYQREGSGGAGCLVTAIVAGVLAVIGGVVFVSAKRGGAFSSISGPSAEELAKVKLEKGPSALGSKLGANVTETSIYVKLSNDRYDYVTMSWDKQHPEAPTSFYFGPKKGQKADPSIEARLAKHLRGGLDKNHSWRWHGASFGYGADGHFNASVRPVESGSIENPRWKEQIDLLYRIAVADVLGAKTTIGEDEVRDLLAGGYPLADVGAIDPATEVDAAEKVVFGKFPGAVRVSGSGVELDVPVDHPWILSLELEWPNQKNATLQTVRVHPAGGYDQLGPHVGDFARCLTKAFGAPKVNETDYLKKKKAYDFRLPNGVSLYLQEYGLDLRAGWGDKQKLDAKTFATFTKALDDCR